MIVAIDGPAGSGKSTTARRVAERLGWLYLDTGAMYRAAALAFLDAGHAFTEEVARQFAPTLDVDLRRTGSGLAVHLDGQDVSARIRTPAATEAASRVSALPAVRERLVDEQRRIAQRAAASGEGVVIEGRDIGTVVFPDAELKIFLTADPTARAQRRHREMGDQDVPLEQVLADITDRDERDSSRDVAPLRAAADAVELDTTALTLDEQVERVLSMIIRRRAEHSPA